MIFWLMIMALIWLLLLGWARIVTGTFNPTEIAMTLVVGGASIAGIAVCVRWRTAIPAMTAMGVSLLFAVLQVAAMAISRTPYIAQR